MLRPPPQPLEYRCDEYGDFVLSVGRLDRAKRVDLLLEAAAADGDLRVVIAGEGPDRPRLEELAGSHRLDGRVTFTGRLDDDALADQYAKCLAVFYAPIDEDMGFVPFEAFLAEKPVVTTRDAGGPLEVVEDRRTGLVCEPSPSAVAEALAWLRAHPDEARAQGRAGKGVAVAADLGRRPSTACSPHESRVLLAAAARPLGDRRLQRTPAARARAAGRGQGREAAPACPARLRRRPLPRRQQLRTRTRGSSRRCGSVRASSSCTTSCCTTSSPG